METEQLW